MTASLSATYLDDERVRVRTRTWLLYSTSLCDGAAWLGDIRSGKGWLFVR